MSLPNNLTRVQSLVIDASLTAQDALRRPSAPTMASLRQVQQKLDEAIEILESMNNNPRLITI